MGMENVKPFKEGDQLTPKQQKWIDEYIKGCTYEEASIRAGYSGANPRAMGYQNSIKFKDIIEARRKELVKELKSNSIAELEDIFEFWTNTFKNEDVKLTDRIKASELLAKAKGGFIEKVEVKKVDTNWFVEDENNG